MFKFLKKKEYPPIERWRHVVVVQKEDALAEVSHAGLYLDGTKVDSIQLKKITGLIILDRNTIWIKESE